ncbi:MAG: PEP-utilizing enzyme [Acidimicrobiales bacterium]
MPLSWSRRVGASGLAWPLCAYPTVSPGGWEPITDDEVPLQVGEQLHGIAAGPGMVRGAVRVLRDADFGELQAGEVLVARVTDVGWTPLFAYAGAVVTDVGALISHAAVVAREMGIPCVVGTGSAATRLRTGQLVEVDGTAGTVRVLPLSGQ